MKIKKVGKAVSTPIATFPTPTGYKISNITTLTHIRTSGNIKLTFQTLIFKIMLVANVLSAAETTVISRLKSIIDTP